MIKFLLVARRLATLDEWFRAKWFFNPWGFTIEPQSQITAENLSVSGNNPYKPIQFSFSRLTKTLSLPLIKNARKKNHNNKLHEDESDL